MSEQYAGPPRQEQPETRDQYWSFDGGGEQAGKSEITATPPHNPNRFDFLVDLAAAVDNFRIFPRAFISVYIYVFYESVHWFMNLEAPSVEQAGLISVLTGIGAAWFGLYVRSKGDG